MHFNRRSGLRRFANTCARDARLRIPHAVRTRQYHIVYSTLSQPARIVSHFGTFHCLKNGKMYAVRIMHANYCSLRIRILNYNIETRFFSNICASRSHCGTATIFARESRAKIRIGPTFLFSHFARKWGNNFHNLLAQVSQARVCTFFFAPVKQFKIRIVRNNNIYGIIEAWSEHRLMTEEIKVNSKKYARRTTVQPSRIQLHSDEFIAQMDLVSCRDGNGMCRIVAYHISSLTISFLMRG